MNVPISKAAIGLTLGMALAACSSGVDMAKTEMTDSCVNSSGGRLTEGECSCMTDRAFAELNSEELAFVDDVYSLPPGTPDSEAAEMIGMDQGEFNRLSRSFASKIGSSAIGAAMECVAS
ncbi:hypothetical protein [Aurantiacibacter gilvus]|uniref:Lipoprotein n=1 Tax=Aurantiacibacter gilvus TaxID=3139141 RepID=A0ABU9I9W9_9SPHN